MHLSPDCSSAAVQVKITGVCSLPQCSGGRSALTGHCGNNATLLCSYSSSLFQGTSNWVGTGSPTNQLDVFYFWYSSPNLCDPNNTLSSSDGQGVQNTFGPYSSQQWRWWKFTVGIPGYQNPVGIYVTPAATNCWSNPSLVVLRWYQPLSVKSTYTSASPERIHTRSTAFLASATTAIPSPLHHRLLPPPTFKKSDEEPTM